MSPFCTLFSTYCSCSGRSVAPHTLPNSFSCAWYLLFQNLWSNQNINLVSSWGQRGDLKGSNFFFRLLTSSPVFILMLHLLLRGSWYLLIPAPWGFVVLTGLLFCGFSLQLLDFGFLFPLLSQLLLVFLQSIFQNSVDISYLPFSPLFVVVHLYFCFFLIVIIMRLQEDAKNSVFILLCLKWKLKFLCRESGKCP